MTSLKYYKGYIIDLDGTMYKGNHRIDGAAEFVDELYKNKIPYLFLTNNSTKTPVDFSDKLNQMNIKATPEQIVTSSLATAQYIHHIHPKAHCMVIGEEGLHDALLNKDLHIVTDEKECDYVVIGLDHHITYEKFSRACLAIRNGAKFISTNGDVAIPTERGLVPGNGALTSVITVSTGVEPTFIGKPENIIMEEALAVLGSQKEESIMVGDNYNTDILAGMNAGIDTLMVFSGITPYENYAKLQKKPTYYVQNLFEWIENL